MLLRGSSDHTGDTYDFRSINGEAADASGIPHARLLIQFAEAVLDSKADFVSMRQEVKQTLSTPALVDSAAVIAIFNAVVRIADATGISLEDYKVDLTATLRSELGIDNLRAAPQPF
ncbi:MAG: hypothetical protein ETSY2_18145 [Candidatus Entotheonella gemina]|uniref:Uncharacterized protein n=1 Tax=Candidatus Entotheonella gemina TaxID=1429439 RepID=W4M7D3_9BACT|nr:MAG: hypothetical protein ETSY2_18145 [Candidatus Entotheonella gemina]